MAPHRCLSPYDWPALLALIRDAFADMEGRIDPPSSMHALTAESIADQAAAAEVWAIGTPPLACVFLTERPEALYVGKLAVARGHRRQGLGSALIALAETRARALGKPWLELQTRVELTENQATFTAMGFAETGRSAHAGFARPTSITYRRAVVRAPG